MIVYRRCPKTGFVETINTDGGYKPVGWSASYNTAVKKKK